MGQTEILRPKWHPDSEDLPTVVLTVSNSHWIKKVKTLGILLGNVNSRSRSLYW